ncbi:hypothetical protein EVAR_23288_1 [Eumeta japonica]|uniref:Uncharacterized protein n=1 Tax=Eumeta variegata TaxID=151549 RepID=A0A4C1V579_EUMVA|nr:hypothetical protein EVAR_23288_1 [Eumeta japonica]
MSKVTIRPVLSGTVPFFGTPSRCPRERLRDAELSRFQVKVKEKYELCLFVYFSATTSATADGLAPEGLANKKFVIKRGLAKVLPTSYSLPDVAVHEWCSAATVYFSDIGYIAGCAFDMIPVSRRLAAAETRGERTHYRNQWGATGRALPTAPTATLLYLLDLANDSS